MNNEDLQYFRQEKFLLHTGDLILLSLADQSSNPLDLYMVEELPLQQNDLGVWLLSQTTKDQSLTQPEYAYVVSSHLPLLDPDSQVLFKGICLANQRGTFFVLEDDFIKLTIKKTNLEEIKDNCLLPILAPNVIRQYSNLPLAS